MPLLKTIYNKARDKIDQASNSSPPPVPNSSKPPPSTSQPGLAQQQPVGASSQAPYWSPIFNPRSHITQHFHQETGQHGWGNNELQNYTNALTNAFFTPDGKLIVRGVAASHAPTPSEQYTSARLVSYQKLSRQSGELVVRVTAPSARGIWPAVWLLPAQPSMWPDDGEIDIFEAWDAVPINHSCLHWGHYHGSDLKKHSVLETHVPDLTNPEGMEYRFVWQQDDEGRRGRCIWYIGGVPVMKAKVPNTTKRLSEWQVIINIAMGGDVCKGRIPDDGTYDLIIHSLHLYDQPMRGWHGFDADWKSCKEGHVL